MPPKNRPATEPLPDQAEDALASLAPLDAPTEPVGQTPSVVFTPEGAPENAVPAEEPHPDVEPDLLTAAPLAAPDADKGTVKIEATRVDGAAARPAPKPEGRYIDEAGDPITAAIFRDDNPMFTYVVTTQRVYETWTPAGMRTALSRLVYPREARVPRNLAAQFLADAGLR